MPGAQDEFWALCQWSAFIVVSNLEYSGPRDAMNVSWAFFDSSLTLVVVPVTLM